MNWLEPVDNYCERIGSGFWAEPLNALSNGAFIIAGLVLLAMWAGTPRRGSIGLFFTLNVLVIGFGSFLFHTLANRWSSLADVLPITLFIHGYLLVALHTYLSMKWWLAAGATAVFFVVSPMMGAALAHLMGSSAFYVPALLAIFGVAAAGRKRDAAISNGLRDAGLIFAVSIAFRAADVPLCEALPQGTHARWHVLNSVVLFLLVRLYLKSTAMPAAR